MQGSSFLKEIEDKIGYEFKNKELLMRAFTHSSYSNENRNAESYERLEFLGDATLGFVIGLFLYRTFPSYQEGRLSKIRAGMVDRNTIATVIESLDLIKYMRAGAGNASANLATSVKTKCDLFEAIIGAIVIDNDENIQKASEFIMRFLEEKVNYVHDDYKSKVYEQCSRQGKTPEFKVKEKTNLGNKAHFTVALYIDGKKMTVGEGVNTKAAEQEACKAFLNK